MPVGHPTSYRTFMENSVLLSDLYHFALNDKEISFSRLNAKIVGLVTMSHSVLASNCRCASTKSIGQSEKKSA
jgi:hypothetical protein